MTFKILSVFTILLALTMAPVIGASAQIRPNTNPYNNDNSQCNLSSGRCNETFGITSQGYDILTNYQKETNFSPKTQISRPDQDCQATETCPLDVGSISTKCGLFEICDTKSDFAPKTQSIRPNQDCQSTNSCETDVSYISNGCDILENCPSNKTTEPNKTFECTLFEFNCPIPTDCITPIFVLVNPCFQPYQNLQETTQVFCFYDEYGFEVNADSLEQCEKNRQNQNPVTPNNCYSINQDLCEGIEPEQINEINCDDIQDGVGYNKCNSTDIYDGIRPGRSNTPESFYIGENDEQTEDIYYIDEEVV